MPVSKTTPGRLGARVIAPIRVAFRQRNDVGSQDEGTFAAQWLAYALHGTLRRCPRGQLRMTRGRCGSLLLHRDGLAPSTPCRSPGALRSSPESGLKSDLDQFRFVPTTTHSITWSAQGKTLSGKVFPSEAAVLIFRANSEVTGCSTGSSV